MLLDKPTRDHHTDTLKAKKEVFIAGCQLCGNLPRSCSPQLFNCLSFLHKKAYSGWHVSVSKQQSYRSQNRRARLVHLETFLEL